MPSLDWALLAQSACRVSAIAWGRVMTTACVAPPASASWSRASTGSPLVVRPRDLFDNATPSGNSAAVMALLRLGELTGETRYTDVARRVLEGTADFMTRVPVGFGHLLCALDFHLATPREVVIELISVPADARRQRIGTEISSSTTSRGARRCIVRTRPGCSAFSSVALA